MEKSAELTLPSNRQFGLFFAVIFTLMSTYLYYKALFSAAVVCLVGAGLFLVLALVKPALLLPLNKLWMKFGLLLGRIINPIVLGAIYILLFTPIAVVTRLFGRDELGLNNAKDSSYWKQSKSRAADPTSFKDQF